MDFAQWRRQGAWSGIVAPGAFGQAGTPGIHVELRENLGIATIISRKGREADVHATLSAFIGAPPPVSPKVVRGTSDLVWAGRDQWLLVTEQADAIPQLTLKLAGHAAVSDQSASRAVIRVSGSRIRDALAKGCMIDLHPRAFGPGDAALTSIAYVGVQLWQRDDSPTYELAVTRSMAGSFWSWFEGSAAEFGCTVR